jgi:hypothetical protein
VCPGEQSRLKCSQSTNALLEHRRAVKMLCIGFMDPADRTMPRRVVLNEPSASVYLATGDVHVKSWKGRDMKPSNLSNPNIQSVRTQGMPHLVPCAIITFYGLLCGLMHALGGCVGPMAGVRCAITHWHVWHLASPAMVEVMATSCRSSNSRCFCSPLCTQAGLRRKASSCKAACLQRQVNVPPSGQNFHVHGCWKSGRKLGLRQAAHCSKVRCMYISRSCPDQLHTCMAPAKCCYEL